MSTIIKTLADLTCGEKRIVIGFNGGSEFQQRVTSLGIYVGCEVEVLGGRSEGGMLIGVGESRIALGCGMAKKVILA